MARKTFKRRSWARAEWRFRALSITADKLTLMYYGGGRVS